MQAYTCPTRDVSPIFHACVQQLEGLLPQWPVPTPPGRQRTSRGEAAGAGINVWIGAFSTPERTGRKMARSPLPITRIRTRQLPHKLTRRRWGLESGEAIVQQEHRPERELASRKSRNSCGVLAICRQLFECYRSIIEFHRGADTIRRLSGKGE